MSVVERPRVRRSTAPWRVYAKGSEVDHFSAFCSEHLVQSIDQWDNLPLDLEAWQRRMMGEALAYDDQGWPVWRSVVIVMPRKNGKTVLLAAYAIYRLLTSEGAPEILMAASSDKQAGRLFDAAAAFVRKSPELSSLIRVRDFAGELVREDGGGKILRMSSDPQRLHGYNPSLVICDELAQWTTPSLRKAYAALTSGGGARQAPQTFTITTAGEAHERDDSILGRVLDTAARGSDVESSPGRAVCRLWESATLVFNWSAPTDDPSDVKAMKLANPASWVLLEFLARQAANPELSRAQVLQLHGCVWAAGDESFVAAERWRALASSDAGAGPGDADVFLGFDGSRSYDTTVAAWAWRLEDGRIAVKSHVWSTRSDAPHHELVRGGEIDFGALEGFVEDELFAKFNVREAAFDPRYLIRSMQLIQERVGDARIAAVEPNSKLMRDAIASFHQLVIDGGIVHDGDPVLAQHVAAAAAKQDDKGWMISKRVQRRPIDALIASILAVWRCSLGVAAEPLMEVW